MKMLKLDEEEVPNKELNVSVTLPMPTENISGDSSGTDTLHKGFKAKEISVRFIVPFDEAERLGDVFFMAEQLGDDGQPWIYNITNDTANAANVRQVRFSTRLVANEMEALQAWKVSFTLLEYRSVPEKKEERLEDQPQAETNAAPGAIVAPESQASPSAQSGETLSSVEQVLQKLENFAKNAIGSSNE